MWLNWNRNYNQFNHSETNSEKNARMERKRKWNTNDIDRRMDDEIDNVNENKRRRACVSEWAMNARSVNLTFEKCKTEPSKLKPSEPVPLFSDRVWWLQVRARECVTRSVIRKIIFNWRCWIYIINNFDFQY